MDHPACLKARLSVPVNVFRLHAAADLSDKSGDPVCERVEKLAVTADTIASALTAYADSVNNNELKGCVHYSLSVLQRMRDNILVDVCNVIHIKATEHLADLAKTPLLELPE